MIINPIICGNGGETAEIFVTGLSETDTVTCTKDGKTKQGKWVDSKTVMHQDIDTLLLLHGDEFTDSSVSDHEITASGAVISSDEHKFGEKSFYFNGSSYLYTIVDSNLDLGSEDFTIECWVYQTVLSGYPRIFDYTTNDFHLEINKLGQVYWKIGGVISTSSAAVSINEWNHIALVRSGTMVTCYLNGTSICSGTVSGSLPITVGGKLAIGYGLPEGTTNYLKGYIDEFRISKVARWTANFTPPTEPYSNTVAVIKSGWLFDKLKEYGTYTITATNGTDTTTQDVLVDMAIEFDIEMSYKLYLYNLGDECESVTGGWDSRSDFTDVNGSKFVLKPYNVTRSKSNIILSAESNSYKDECFLFAPKNKVSLDKYDKLNINVVSSKISNTTGSNIFIRLCTGTDLNSSIADTNIITSGQTYSGVVTVDVTNFNYEIYLLIHTVFWGYTGNGSITFDKVWLE